jgi:hypothetical protein
MEEKNITPERIIGILKNVSEFIVATLVNETEHTLEIKNPALLGITGENNQVSINFIPIEMLSLQPAVNIRNLLSNPVGDIIYPVYKGSVWKWDFELAQNVKDNYSNLTRKTNTPPAPDKLPSEENIVKLF